MSDPLSLVHEVVQNCFGLCAKGEAYFMGEHSNLDGVDLPPRDICVEFPSQFAITDPSGDSDEVRWLSRWGRSPIKVDGPDGASDAVIPVVFEVKTSVSYSTALSGYLADLSYVDANIVPIICTPRGLHTVALPRALFDEPKLSFLSSIVKAVYTMRLNPDTWRARVYSLRSIFPPDVSSSYTPKPHRVRYTNWDSELYIKAPEGTPFVPVEEIEQTGKFAPQMQGSLDDKLCYVHDRTRGYVLTEVNSLEEWQRLTRQWQTASKKAESALTKGNRSALPVESAMVNGEGRHPLKDHVQPGALGPVIPAIDSLDPDNADIAGLVNELFQLGAEVMSQYM